MALVPARHREAELHTQPPILSHYLFAGSCLLNHLAASGFKSTLSSATGVGSQANLATACLAQSLPPKWNPVPHHGLQVLCDSASTTLVSHNLHHHTPVPRQDPCHTGLPFQDPAWAWPSVCCLPAPYSLRKGCHLLMSFHNLYTLPLLHSSL